MCPGVDSASENEYQVNPGGKYGRCIRLTTYHLHVPMSKNLGTLTSWNPVGLFRPVMGQLRLTKTKTLQLKLRFRDLIEKVNQLSIIVASTIACPSMPIHLDYIF
jgi:hypothetical protein